MSSQVEEQATGAEAAKTRRDEEVTEEPTLTPSPLHPGVPHPATGPRGGGTPSSAVSVVIPVYNEEENLAELYRRLRVVLDGLGRPAEIILVDDGSRDRSVAMLREL